ncbi:MAG TPA: alkaline phosphatase family protein [Caulifigura sp.]|nr:alkaline phosphatase family protein [Caulifigura sp.]
MRLFVLSCALMVVSAGALSAAEPAKDRCVVLVSLDGLANFYLDDPKADMPYLRSMIKNGTRAAGTVCTFPTVTWPNHTTMVTGAPSSQHGVLGNDYLDRKTGEKVKLLTDPVFDKEELLKTPTIYDAAHQAGLKTAGIIWPATRNAKSLDFQVPDMAKDGWQKYGTPSWLEELRKAGIPVDKHGAYCEDSSGGGVLRDWLYTKLAAHLFENHPPNLMLVHLIEVDHIEHKYGPQTPEAYWAVKFIDDRLRDVVEAAKKSPYADKTTFVVVSDHGFLPITREIRPNVLLKQAGLITMEGNTVKSKAAYAVSNGGGCMVYLLDPAKKAEMQQKLVEALSVVEGVDAVITPNRFAELGLASPDKDPRYPDFWLGAKSGYSFSDAAAGDDVVTIRETPGGTHGYLPAQDALHGTLVLQGYGVKEGVKLPLASNMDIAPTIAKLLGVELPTAKGKVLTGALK